MEKTQILLQAEKISTLSKIEATANDFVEAVKNGEIAPLKAWTDLAKLQKLIDVCKEKIQEEALQDAEHYEKNASIYGCSVQVKEVGTKYDYSRSEVWKMAKQEEEDIAGRRKKIEAMLKNATPEAPYIDTATGEAITGVPKSSKTTVVVTINK